MRETSQAVLVACLWLHGIRAPLALPRMWRFRQHRPLKAEEDDSARIDWPGDRIRCNPVRAYAMIRY